MAIDRKCMRRILLVASLSFCTLALAAQNVQPGEVTVMEKTPVYRVNVVARTVEAINYRHGSTKVDFQGTSLMPDASGQAKVESKAGRLEVNAEFKNVRNANYYGPEYLTYVLWAVTPDGRPVNLGEVVPNDKHEVRIHALAHLQDFGMIVTAEPYFAVTRPSDMTVLENAINKHTKSLTQPITARYEATEKGEYTVDLASNQLPASNMSIEQKKETPLELLEARNAVAIAQATGAAQYAPEVLSRAQQQVGRADEDLQQNESTSKITASARSATEAAEDARVLTIRKKEEARAAAEQQAAEERTQLAQQQALTEQQRAQNAQVQTLQAEQAAQQAQQERQAAEQAKAEALQQQQQAEAARQAALQQQQALAAQAQTAQAAAQNAQAQAQTAEQRAQAAEQEKEQMRQRLTAQLNQVLQTKDTARGLIVNMNDVLFATDQATLKPTAKMRLAKVAGIIEAYPDLKLQIEGFTDSTGSEQYNQELSERRAAAVRDFLISEGVNVNNVTAQGFGPADPIASNSTPQGRQLNRRVDLVVNGEAIAVQHRPAINQSGAPAAMAAPTSSDTQQPADSSQPNGSQPNSPEQR